MGKIVYNSTPIKAEKDYSRVLYVHQDVDMNEEILFHENTAIIFEPNVVHNEFYFSPSTDILSIGFRLNKNETLINRFSTTNDETYFIKRNILNIEEEFEKKDFNYSVNIESYINLINNFILRHNESKKAISAETINFEYILNYLNESFRTKISLDSLANMIGYCPDHFRILFKKNVGMTPKQYIIKKRMEYAEYLINNSNASIGDIAKECGYEDYFQFSTYYKKYFGHPPKETRTK